LPYCVLIFVKVSGKVSIEANRYEKID